MALNVKIKKLVEEAILPTYASAGAAGADLFSLPVGEGIDIPPHQTVFIHTGIAAAIPEGYVGLIYARSGMACKRDLAPANKVGVIDCDYRGEIMVALHNHSEALRHVDAGERIAQLVIAPVLQAAFEVTADLDDTARGAGGFGSTGTASLATK